MNTTIEDNNLFKMLLDNDSDETEENDKDDNLCLISSEKLTDNYIKLPCGHSFNYESIYDAVHIQKNTYNPLNQVYLRINELQCPYCRKIHNKLLPFIPHTKYSQRKRGVTGPKQFCMKHMECEWVFKSGKQKGCKCCKEAYKTKYGIYCKTHQTRGAAVAENISQEIVWTSEMEAYKKYTIPQLKEILHKKKLKKTGNKATLIHRLVSNK